MIHAYLYPTWIYCWYIVGGKSTLARAMHEEVWVSERWSVRFASLIWLSLLYLPFALSQRENAAATEVSALCLSPRLWLRDLVIRVLRRSRKMARSFRSLITWRRTIYHSANIWLSLLRLCTNYISYVNIFG